MPVQFNENQRKRRAGSVTCRKSLCGGDMNMMFAQCAAEDCMRDGRWCYYLPQGGYGTTNHGLGEDRNRFWHFQIQGFMCMPCCAFRPVTDSRMPVCSNIAMSTQLCDWMRRNGRCGEDGRWGA